VNAVNTEANDPGACGLAAVAFIPDGTVATQTVQARLLEIVRIHVVAGYNGSDWQRISGMTQFAVMPAAGVEI